MAYLLDTDVLIWHLRGHAPTVALLQKLAREHEQETAVLPLGCSAVSVFELRAGVRPEEEDVTERLVLSLEIYPVDEVVARRAADYYRAFRRRGVTLHIADLLIAATAALRGLILVTYNRDHFPMADLRLYGPMPDPE